ncbi:phosphotransferase enzyme family protein [Paenibacillus spongiae]|uniref:Phosphotransferase n=1 Tax=Paenibacillus spongiae TaxID=2909671 RepID=A0ABY5S6V9_9BACL|nr:phosphotransferase [Paenibacillus spongiae]UVI29228.1 phosphotransferase [Paenibacillus spongiae]
MASQEVLSRAAESFGFDVKTLVFISNSCNEVYRFSMNNQDYILRLTEKPVAYVEKIRAEVDWMHDLVKNGVSASLPIRTIDNQLTAVYNGEDKCCITTAFHMAPGRFFDKNDPQLWGPAIFKKWGEVMGRMHLLSKSYKPSDIAAKRDGWSKWEIENPYLQQGHYRLLLEKLRSLESTIEALPRDRHSYGLIHNDFHPYNFHIQDGAITVFDFDDSMYGWFSLDIAIAAAHAVWWGAPNDDRESKNEFAQSFLNDFLEGYFKQNHLDRYWIQQIPMFMDYRNLCSYFWWLSSWDGDENNLSVLQQSAVINAVRIIQNGRPFDGCDIRM